MWFLEHNNKRIREFGTREEAETVLEKMGSVIAAHYKLVVETGNPKTDRMLMEGMVANDLNNILLPRISVDEYVPADPETDNVVVAFFIKGVPEAVLPFKNFAEKSNGVRFSDYGDSDTVVNTSIVYVEFDRENLEIEDIHNLMVQASMLAGIEVDDFTMTFPHTNKKFPYDSELMLHYFRSRNERKNRIAQQKALDAARKDFEADVARMSQGEKEEPYTDSESREMAAQGGIAQGDADQNNQPAQSQGAPENTGQGLAPAQESIVDRLSRLPLTG